MASKLKIYSIGIVAEAKDLSSKFIKVTPVEILPLMDGNVTPNPQTIETSGVDGEGAEYVATAKIDITLTAEWFSLETNRRTPPDVRAGEQVLIFQYGDDDKYFWTSMGRDDKLRRLETVVYAWSDEPDPNKDIELTSENTYSVEVSTHRKHLTIRTAKSNGEAFQYTVQINAADSNVQIMDDAGNFMLMDSANTNIQFHNADDTNVELNKRDINMYAPNDMNIVVDNNYNMEVGVDMTVSVGNNTTITTGKTLALSSTDYVNNASGSITNITSSYTTTCPTNTFTGNLLVGGALAIAGGGGGAGAACAVTGDMTIEGDIEQTGSITVSGTVTAGNFVAPGGSWHHP